MYRICKPNTARSRPASLSTRVSSVSSGYGRKRDSWIALDVPRSEQALKLLPDRSTADPLEKPKPEKQKKPLVPPEPTRTRCRGSAVPVLREPYLPNADRIGIGRARLPRGRTSFDRE